MIDVLLVYDDNVIRKGVRYLLETTSDINVVAIAFHAIEAIAQVRSYHPHVVILDVFAPSINGLDLTRKISDCCPGTRALAVSHFDHPEHIQRALQAGVAGYVLKSEIGRELVEAIRSLYRGRQYFSRKIASRVRSSEEDDASHPAG